VGTLGLLQLAETGRLGQRLPELRFAQLRSQRFARARVNEIDASLRETLMKLIDGGSFTVLLAAAAADGDEDRADGEARDDGIPQSL
jgi:hypothetical protein